MAEESELSFTPSSPIATTPPDAASVAPATPSRSDRIAEDYRRSDEAIADVRRATQAEQELATRQAEEGRQDLARYRAMSSQIMEDRRKAHQDLQDRRIKEEPAPRKENDADHDWLTASMMLGALAGGLTRNHVTNALGAMSGAIQGYQQGSQQAFENNMKTWQANRERAKDSEQQALNDYKEIIENQKLNMDQMSMELSLKAQIHKDEAMATAAQSKNSLTIAQLFDQRAKYLEQWEMSDRRLTQQWDLAQQRMTQQQAIAQMRAIGADPNKLPDLVKAIAEYREPPIPGQRGSAIMQLVEEYSNNTLSKPYNATHFYQVRSQATGLGSTMGRAAGNIDLLMDSIPPTIEVAAKAAQAVPATGFPAANRVIQSVAEASGDPAIKRFQLANMELAEKFAALMNPRSANITNYQARTAREMISTADSPEAYTALLEQIAAYATRQHDAVMRGLAGEPFPDIVIPKGPRKLVPGEREYLPSGAGGPAKEVATKPAWESPLPQWLEDRLPNWLSPRKPAAQPPNLPEGFTYEGTIP